MIRSNRKEYLNLSSYIFYSIATIIGINGTLLSVTSNTQEVQLNCFTSRVKPSEIIWSFQTPGTQVEGSELLDETNMTYRHYIQVTGTFIAGIQASCNYIVNGQTDSINYSLQGLIKSYDTSTNVFKLVL